MSCSRGWFSSDAQTILLDSPKVYFMLYFPPKLAYYLMAVLVSLPNTRFLRQAMLPLALVAMYRAAIFLDISGGDPAMQGQNGGITILMAALAMRSVGWAFEPEQLIRVGKLEQRGQRTRTLLEVLSDAGDLCLNQRGIGWNWGRHHVYGSSVSRPIFVGKAVVAYIVHALFYEAFLYGRNYVYSHPDKLPWLIQRVAEVSPYAILPYMHHEAHYALLSIIGVLIFRQEPKEWPAQFNEPWRSTSLIDLWGHRWHQDVYDFATRAGGRPLGALFGKPGFLLGTFLASGLWHDAGTWGTTRSQGLCCSISMFFVLNGVGVASEWGFRRLSGKRVDGPAGMLWLLIWVLMSVLVVVDSPCAEFLTEPFNGLTHLQLVASLRDALWR